MDHQPPRPLLPGTDGALRCWWCVGDPLYEAYHDREWGKPLLEDRRLFEKLCLEGFQAGLSWLVVLRKRPALRAAFADFDFGTLAGWTDRDLRSVLNREGIIRNIRKVRAVVENARCALRLIERHGSLVRFFAGYFDDSGWRDGRLAAETATARRLARDLKRCGWTFVGPRTAYAFMQSVGLVNDHWPQCPRFAPVERARRAWTRL